MRQSVLEAAQKKSCKKPWPGNSGGLNDLRFRFPVGWIMPVTVRDLLDLSGLDLTAQFLWGERVAIGFCGVYLVAMANTSDKLTTLPEAPISRSALMSWLTHVPVLTVNGRSATVDSVGDRLRSFWLPNETVLYIGQTRRAVSDRISQFYRHRLGNHAPHAGGQWLKTLDVLSKLTVYVACTDEPRHAEELLLRIFLENVSPNSRKKLFDSGKSYPFANLTGPLGRKIHGIQ